MNSYSPDLAFAPAAPGTLRTGNGVGGGSGSSTIISLLAGNVAAGSGRESWLGLACPLSPDMSLYFLPIQLGNSPSPVSSPLSSQLRLNRAMDPPL